MPSRSKIKVRIGDHIILAKRSYRQWLTRDVWGAEPPRGPVEKTDGPVKQVFFHYRSGTKPCYTTEECSATLRKIQENHFRRRMADIAFNFLVASGGNVYEGRGFGVLPSPDLKKAGPPGDRIDVAFIGDWTQESLPYAIFEGGQDVIRRGLDQEFIDPDWQFHAVILKKKPTREQLLKNKEQPKRRQEMELVETKFDINEEGNADTRQIIWEKFGSVAIESGPSKYSF